MDELTNLLEALIFAAPRPVSRAQLLKAVAATSPEGAEPVNAAAIGAALDLLQQRWEGLCGGICLIEVADGFAFRTSPRFGDALRLLREEKPQRLSRPALETLAIVAYRQPATKPEVDHIRGVDCGGTLKVLLDRELVRIVGKREEAGRPLCYGTTNEFLNLFCLPSLRELPSLRDMVELQDESLETMQKTLGKSIEELAAGATRLGSADAEPAIEALHDAVVRLRQTEDVARDQLAEQGVILPDDEAAAEAAHAAGHTSLEHLAERQRRRSAS
jgi:segregation and condensation protein B